MWGQQLGYFLPLAVVFGIVGVVGGDEVASSVETGSERASNLRKYHHHYHHHHLLFVPHHHHLWTLKHCFFKDYLKTYINYVKAEVVLRVNINNNKHSEHNDTLLSSPLYCQVT